MHLAGPGPLLPLAPAPPLAQEPLAPPPFELPGPEIASAKQYVYLVTFSRILPETGLLGIARDVRECTRLDIAACLLDVLNNPDAAAASGGRPRRSSDSVVKKLVVFREEHADGSPHFHAALALCRQMRFAAPKRALQTRHGLASHWSCSHTQWWSALRYCVMPSPAKAAVDAEPFQAVPADVAVDLFHECQEPYVASAWNARREQRDKCSAAVGRAAKFSKADFTAVVLDKGLRTPAAVMSWFQLHGTAAMQVFANHHQRRLQEFLDDALEWSVAGRVALEESRTDWAHVCCAAEETCAQHDTCPYARLTDAFFRANAANFARGELAAALRAVLVCGCSKTSPVPFLVGPTNSGKSTLLESFDELFGHQHVFHKPALTDAKYGLRNWLKHKRFAFWDDFRPVEYARAGVLPVATFLNAFNQDWFEIQLPQNAHDGNQDFRWIHGAAFTGKEEGLWDATPKVSAEDVRHMQSRVVQFRVTASFPRGAPGDRPRCKHHLAKWICAGAQEHDAHVVLTSSRLRVVQGCAAPAGLEAFLTSAAVFGPQAEALKAEVAATGAVDVRELKPEDWAALPAWPSLRLMEQRRIAARAAAAAVEG